MKKRSTSEDPPPRANLAMVAARAGVSPATVSRILNGSAKVSEAKCKAVQDAIADLGFRPDPSARGLAGGRTMSVGVLTQFIDSPFYGEALRGIEDVLQEHHYVPLFASGHWSDPDEQARIELLIERKVDGLIILTGRLSNQTLIETAQKIPVVVTGRYLVANNLFSIDFDNEGGVSPRCQTPCRSWPPENCVHFWASRPSRCTATTCGLSGRTAGPGHLAR